MNPHSLFVDGNVRGLRVNPASGVVIVQSIARLLHGDVGMSAENAVGLVEAGVKQRS